MTRTMEKEIWKKIEEALKRDEVKLEMQTRVKEG
jgi:hypothetical protein